MGKSAFLTPFLALAMALSASAQQPVERSKDMSETVSIQVSGGWDVDWVWRSREMAQSMALSSLFGFDEDSQGTIEYTANLRFDVKLSENVDVLMNFAITRLGDGFPAGLLGAESTGVFGLITQTPKLWDLAIKLSEFLSPGVSLQLGTQNDFTFDVRGNGSPLFFDPHNSISMADNVDLGGITGLDTAGNSDWQQPAGAVVRYQREALQFALALLPAIEEGPPSSDDESAYVATLYYDLSEQVSKGSRVGAIVAINHFGPHTGVITFGGGASLKDIGTPGLELFGEVYFQTGDAGRNAADDDLDAGGFAVKLGGHFDFEAENNPWVEASFTLLSGDDDYTATDSDADNFLSYENVNDLLIIEDSYFGWNWNTNLTVVKISGGISLSTGGMQKNNLQLKAILGFASATEDVGPVGNETDTIGTELDLQGTLWLSKQVGFDARIGFLFGSDVLELQTLPDDEDSTFMFVIGTFGKF